MVRVDRAVARAGRGLQGDRYFDQRGTFSDAHDRGHDLTLIEAEVLDDVVLPAGSLAPEDARRNIVTRGIDLNALVGGASPSARSSASASACASRARTWSA